MRNGIVDRRRVEIGRRFADDQGMHIWTRCDPFVVLRARDNTVRERGTPKNFDGTSNRIAHSFTRQ
jgi:hypothetical protein